MARGIGVSAPYLSAVETGKKNVTDDLVHKIINYLGLAGDQAEELRCAADQSKSEFRICVEEQNDITKQAAAAFARSINSSTLDEAVASRILEILNRTKEG